MIVKNTFKGFDDTRESLKLTRKIVTSEPKKPEPKTKLTRRGKAVALIMGGLSLVGVTEAGVAAVKATAEHGNSKTALYVTRPGDLSEEDVITDMLRVVHPETKPEEFDIGAYTEDTKVLSKDGYISDLGGTGIELKGKAADLYTQYLEKLSQNQHSQAHAVK